MKVVLDTNIIISGTFWVGSSFKILEKVTNEEIKIIVSLDILKEYDKIIHSEEILKKINSDQQAKISVLYKLLSKAIIVEPKVAIEIIKDDPDDNKFLEAAIEGQAKYIISNDKHLLKLKKYNEIPIVSSEEYLKIITS